MPFALSENARIYWQLHGSAGFPWLVLLHGIGAEMALYDQAVPFLEQHFRMLRIDNRGHGASDAPRGDYSLELLARDTLAAMDAAGVDRAIVCGTSLGAMIAMQLALDAPDRVGGLVLACTSAKMDKTFWSQRIAAVRDAGVASIAEAAVSKLFSADFAKANPARVDTMLSGVFDMSSDGYAGCAAAIRDMDLLARLPAIAAPTLVIAGQQDAATPFEGHGDRIVAAIPGAEAEVFPAGHLACIEQPEQFTRSVVGVARRCS